MGGVLLMAIQPQIMAIQPQPLPVVLKPQMHTNKKNEVCQKSVIEIILMEGLQFRCLKSRSCELRSASAWSACQHLCVQNECHPLWTARLKRVAVPNNAKALNCGWRTCDQAQARETRSCSLDRKGRSTNDAKARSLGVIALKKRRQNGSQLIAPQTAFASSDRECSREPNAF